MILRALSLHFRSLGTGFSSLPLAVELPKYPGCRTQGRPIQVNHREGEPRGHCELMEIQRGYHGNVMKISRECITALKDTDIFGISGEYDGNMHKILKFASLDWFNTKQR